MRSCFLSPPSSVLSVIISLILSTASQPLSSSSLHPTNQRNALQSINLSVFTSLYSLTTSPFFIITSYQLTNGEIIRSRQLAKTWEQIWRQRRGVVGEVKEFLGQSVTAMSDGLKKSNSFQWQYFSWQQNCPRCMVQFTSIRRSDNWQQWEGRGGLGGEEEGGDQGRPCPVSSRVPVYAQGTTLSWWVLQNQSPRCRMSNFTVELDCVQNRYLGLAFDPSPSHHPHPVTHN